MIILTCDNLSLTNIFGKLISGIGFTAGPGTILAITGKNGIGKTSLLMAIAGIIKPYTGKITIEGEYHIHLISSKQVIRPELTVEENLLFIADLYDTRECIPAAIRYFNLDIYLDEQVKILSSGWKRRVELATLLISNTNIWLLDEPETHLDQETKELLNKMIITRANQGGIILWATNQPTTYPQLNLKDFR